MRNYSQLKFDEFGEFTEEVFIEKFDDADQDNETSSDIPDVDKMDFSDMAISGTDWTTETIILQISKHNIFLDPDFQRREAWTSKAKSKFIESLFLGLPIPQIILAENKNRKGQFIVIDGKQRLLSLQQFVLGQQDNPKVQQLKLVGLEVKKEFNRMTYKDIENSQYCDELTVFHNQPIRTVVIKNWPSFEALYLMFLRMNTGSVKLSPQELRQALFPGDFIKYANKESSENEQLKRMFKIRKPDFRMRDVEVFIRYLAFKHFISEYGGSLQRFLDDTCAKFNNDWDDYSVIIRNDALELSNAMAITYDIFGEEKAFRKFKNNRYEEKYNRSVFDIMVYYFSKVEIRDKIKGNEACIREAFEKLCQDEKFMTSIEFTTKSTEAVRTRFTRWGAVLGEIIGKSDIVPSIGE